jgi:hypothetical protein
LILRQPSRRVLAEGDEGAVGVRLRPFASLALQWFHNGEAVPGGTNAVLTFEAVSRADEGLYELWASNALCQVHSETIVAIASDVTPESFVAMSWLASPTTALALEYANSLAPTATWHALAEYPPDETAQFYVELEQDDAARFYRLNGADAPAFTRAGFIAGWWFEQAAGSMWQIEYVSPAGGWTNWQVLTNLTLPATPYLFLDYDSLADPQRVYRTTPAP